jgi:hypothetical protein
MLELILRRIFWDFKLGSVRSIPKQAQSVSTLQVNWAFYDMGCFMFSNLLNRLNLGPTIFNPNSSLVEMVHAQLDLIIES